MHLLYSSLIKKYILFFFSIQSVINYLILLNTWRFAQFAQIYFLFDNSIGYRFMKTFLPRELDS